MRNDIIVATVVGLIFGLGLVVSGMVKRSKILGFLIINKHWDRKLFFQISFSTFCYAYCRRIQFFDFPLQKQATFELQIWCADKHWGRLKAYSWGSDIWSGLGDWRTMPGPCNRSFSWIYYSSGNPLYGSSGNWLACRKHGFLENEC